MVGVDWEVSLKEARFRTKDKVALQGNMIPDCCCVEHLRRYVKKSHRY